MADELKIPVSAPGAAQAAQDLARVAAAEREVGREAKDAGAKAQEGAAGMQQIAGAARSVLGALGIATGVGAAVSQIVSLVREWQAHMERISQLSRQAGQEMTAIALMQEPGKAGGRVREIAARGAGYGVSPGQAWAAVTELQPQAGGYAGGVAAAEEVWKLQQMGVPAEAAQEAVVMGLMRGVPPAESARAFYAASQAAGIAPVQMAGVAGMALPAFGELGGGPNFMYQAIAGIAQETRRPRQMGTYAAGAAGALMERQGKAGAFWKRQGFAEPGADPLAQLRALAAAGLTTEQDLRKAGFGEGARGISMLLRHLDVVEAAGGTIGARSREAGLLERARAGAEAELPEMVQARRVAGLEAEIGVGEIFGAEAGPARTRELREIVRAQELQKRGLGFLAGGDKRAGWTETQIGEMLYYFQGSWRGIEEPALTSEKGYIAAAVERRMQALEGGVTVNVGGIHYEKGLEDVAGEPVGSGMR
jgi:hypothetical protein